MKLAIILDNIRSVHNVGSIFRTADAAGFEKIYCCGITPSPIDRFKNIRADFAKVALGAEQSVAWEAGNIAAEVIERLRHAGWKIFAVEQAEGSVRYDEVGNFLDHDSHSADEQKIALVLGAEVEGVSPDSLRIADGILEIPMHGKKESLNVAVAFGIVAFELAREFGGKDDERKK